VSKELVPEGWIEERKKYTQLKTLKLFHESNAQVRCIVGPMGSGKSSAAAFEVCLFLPKHLWNTYGITKTRWAVVRNTMPELRNTTQRTYFEWFPQGTYQKQEHRYTLNWGIDSGPHKGENLEVEILFLSCDRPDDVKSFKSLELTGYHTDESIELPEEVKLLLFSRTGRFPKKCPERYGIETTNPPYTNHPTYSNFPWQSPPPGPIPPGKPLDNHAGFWQPPGENEENLRPGYYEEMRQMYRDYPDWVDMYIEGKPGVIIKGRLVYTGFQRRDHVSLKPLKWDGSQLYRGWDNSGNCPACVVIQVPAPHQMQVLREFITEREAIVDFTDRVIESCNQAFPGAEYIDWADPAGSNEFPKKTGGFTSNAALMDEACGVKVHPSEQNLTSRIDAVQRLLNRRDGLLLDPSCLEIQNGFLGGYVYPRIAGTFDQYGIKPAKNRWSHPHDALQYIAVRVFTHIDDTEDLDFLPPARHQPASNSERWMGS